MNAMIPSIEQLLAADPNLSPAFRRLFAMPKVGVLETAHAKADPRRFTGEPPTGFGDFDERRDLGAKHG